MRTAVTIGYEHGSGKAHLITGPEVSVADQRAAIKSLGDKKTHRLFSAVEVWESSGISKWRSFDKESEDDSKEQKKADKKPAKQPADQKPA